MDLGEYYHQVTPTRERVQPEVVRHISSLYRMGGDEQSEIKKIVHSLTGTENTIPRFEFLLLTGGKYSSVKILYRTNEEFMDTLGRRLEIMYPNTFDIERVKVNRIQKLLRPLKHSPQEFLRQYQQQNLQVRPEEEQEVTSVDSIETATVGSDTLRERVEEPTVGDVQDGLTDRHPTPNGHGAETNGHSDADKDAPPLQELDEAPLSEVKPPSELEQTAPVTGLNGPTQDSDGNILARPSLEGGDPIVVHWHGRGERRNDWMTPLTMFSDVQKETDEEAKSDAPLAPLIDFFANSDIPLAFQVTWERMPDWTKKAQRRKRKLLKDRDTVTEKAMQELGDMIHGTSKETRRERRKSHVDEVGEGSQSGESRTGGRVSERSGLIDDKVPNRTFRANIRAACIATEDMDKDAVLRKMKELSSYLDHTEGYFYGLEPEIIRDDQQTTGRLNPLQGENKKPATKEFHRLLTGEIISGSGKKRPDLILNGDELANFTVCPSAENMTVEGSRGTRAEASTRDSLPRPDSETMRKFHQDGLRLGYALDQTKEPEDRPTQLPPSLLTTHYARFGKSGVGKTKALINDILSLYENTDGPTILIDPKGDSLADDLQKAFFQRYGEEAIEEDIIHFPCPDILPAMPFFDLRPGLETESHRIDIIQNKADYYDELLKFVMGREQYEQSKVAPTIIKAVIKALLDETYGDKQYERTNIDKSRESHNYFSHDDLERAMEEMKLYVETEDEEEGSLVGTENERLERALKRHLDSNPQDFAQIMNAVFNRLDYIREDAHLRRIFDNTERKFHFKDMMNKNKVIVFDLGDLRDEATKVMTGYLLTSLWDSLENHSNTVCTQGHENLDVCKQKAEDVGASTRNPPCREDWDEDHMVNLLIDESASAVTSDIMNKMLEQGRSFNLSVGLLMQNPDQMKKEGEQLYRNILNNISTICTANIKELDQDVARILSHENIDTEEFTNRIENLPRGEWIVQLPAVKYFESPPEPFSLKSLPIPSGLDESENPLTESEKRYYKSHLLDKHLDAMQEHYGIERSDYGRGASSNGSASAGQAGSPGNQQSLGRNKNGSESNRGTENANGAGNGSGHNGQHSGAGQLSSSANGSSERSTPSGTSKNGGEQGQGSPEQPAPGVVPSGDGGTVEQGGDTSSKTSGGGSRSGTSSNGASSVAGAAEIAPDTRTRTNEGLDGSVENHENGWKCTHCGTTYKHPEKQAALNCCDSGEVESKTEAEAEAETEPSTSSPQVQGHQSETAQPAPDTGPDGAVTRQDDKPQGKSEGQTDTSSGQYQEPSRRSQNASSPRTPSAGTEAVIPTTYNTDHIDSTVTIDSLDAVEDAITSWTPRTVLALCFLIYEVFPPRLDEEQKQVREHILALGRKHGAASSSDIQLTDEVVQSVIDNGFSPTPDNEVRITDLVTAAHSADQGDKTNQQANQTSGSGSQGESQQRGTNQGKTQQSADRLESALTAASIPSHELAKSKYSREQLDFMATVLEVMNNETSLSRANSLVPVRDHFEQRGADIQQLIDDGLVTPHNITKKKMTYTVEPAGRNELTQDLTAGKGVGDRGDGMPHRYGADLTLAWLQQQPQVSKTASFIPIGGDNIADVVGIAEQGEDERIAVTAEIEGGRSEREVAEYSETQRKGLHDYDSLIKDYRLLKELDKRDHTVEQGHKALWVVRDRDAVVSVCSALYQEDILSQSPEAARHKMKAGGMDALNEDIIRPAELPGISEIQTFYSIEEMLR